MCDYHIMVFNKEEQDKLYEMHELLHTCLNEAHKRGYIVELPHYLKSIYFDIQNLEEHNKTMRGC